MATTYGISSYQNLIDDILDEVGNEELTARISSESVQGIILGACQRISFALTVRSRSILRLIQGQSEYFFSNTDKPVTGTGTATAENLTLTGDTSAGTGTITSVDEAVTGVGTAFLSECVAGKGIVVGSECREILSIESDTALTLTSAFTTDASASAFSITATKFTRELASGCSVTINSVERVIDSIESPNSATVTLPFTAAITTNAFTIDRTVTEIPCDFVPKHATHLEGTFTRRTKVVSMEQMVEIAELEYGAGFYTPYNSPFGVAVTRDASNRRILIVRPAPEGAKDLELHGVLRVLKREHVNDALTAYCPLPSEYNPLVEQYVKAKLYERIKLYRESKMEMQEFLTMLRTYGPRTAGEVRVTVGYE